MADKRKFKKRYCRLCEAKLEYVDFKDKSNEVKIHPLIFQKFNIKKVPAIIYAQCPKKFKYKNYAYIKINLKLYICISIY